MLVEIREQPRNQLSPEVLGIELRSPGLAADTLTCQAFHRPPGKVLKHAHKTGVHHANISSAFKKYAWEISFSIIISKKEASEAL